MNERQRIQPLHILAAYDDSPYSQFALEGLRKLPQRAEIGMLLVMVSAFPSMTDWTARLQLPAETEIDLVYVMEKRPEYELDLLRKASAFWDEIRSVASRHIEAMTAKLKAAGHRVESTLAEAPHIGSAQVEHANTRPCNFVIIGDRRETIVARVLLGSTSRHVLRQAPCNVLIAR